MSLADCPKCWDQHCTCGYAYMAYPPERIAKIAAAAIAALAAVKDCELSTQFQDRLRRLSAFAECNLWIWSNP